MKENGYSFWVDRLAWNQSQYDIIRIDHFRAFDTYWKIPAWCPTAREGEWMLGPSYHFFDTIYSKLKDIRLVAEDLGDLRPEVLTLRDHYNLMGMNVLQFEMAPKVLKRPRNEHVIVYTGTHDNDTLEGSYQLIESNRKISLRRFFHNCGFFERNFHQLVVQFALSTNAELVIIPIQDLLGLKSQARINTPGTIGSPNWEWKLKNLKQVYDLLPKLGEWIKKSGRAE
jgi:4-alpha-glucanotransferase